MSLPKNKQDLRLAVIGLGYVGLPLALEFSRLRTVVAFDTNTNRIIQLKGGKDITREIDCGELLDNSNLLITEDPRDLQSCTCFIVTVPTPIDAQKKPDLQYLNRANQIVGGVLKPGDIVIYESTVYPGCTEEECVPALEKKSKLKFNKDFFCGYSPERINPGDKEHRLNDLIKITSGSTPEVAELIDDLYKSIIDAGTHQVDSIKVAEAAKVIENTQRDLNIALINELAIIFRKMEIDTDAVLEAANTKWNFIPFRPGLVGGHCIGVDPYYLMHQARKFGHQPEILEIARKINDQMPAYVISQLKVAMEEKGKFIRGSKILLMGLAFKENVPDLRNSKALEIFDALTKTGAVVDVFDPVVNEIQAKTEHQITLVSAPRQNVYEAVLLLLAHQEFLEMGQKRIRGFCVEGGIVYDVKSILPLESSDLRL